MRKTSAERNHEDVLAFVAAHLEPCRLTVADLIAGTRMSRATLYRALQAEGGVEAFLFTLRLRTARELIHACTPIAEVRRRCGFTSGAHFSRRFKDSYGVTPREHLRSSAEGRPTR